MDICPAAQLGHINISVLLLWPKKRIRLTGAIVIKHFVIINAKISIIDKVFDAGWVNYGVNYGKKYLI
jgi:hypothetical protein